MVSENYCVSCGETIPEGRQVCPTCENKSVDKAPCTGCSERHEDCREHCDKYKAFREWLDGVNALRRQEEERNRPSRNYFNLLKWRNRK